MAEIKDKTELMKARKDIEREMERFKVCEKETKTKAFSKEGLTQPQKLDPQQAARRELEQWIGQTTSKLQEQVAPDLSPLPACSLFEVTPS